MLDGHTSARPLSSGYGQPAWRMEPGHSAGSILAGLGEHQLTIRDYLRHSHLNVTNQYLQAASETKRLAQEKLVGAILPAGSLFASKSTLIQ